MLVELARRAARLMVPEREDARMRMEILDVHWSQVTCTPEAEPAVGGALAPISDQVKVLNDI